ncbi:MAG: hypothetical protein K0R55_3726, partial [Sporomusa sp.]|nr:hypothetical protein [Sporomusa sp.]
LGRFGGAMILSQENCLYNDHRFTCERWGGDLDANFCIFLCRQYLSAWNKKPLETVSQVASFIFVNAMLYSNTGTGALQRA